MKKLILISVLITQYFNSPCQFQAQIAVESQNWLSKYWLYRWRFVNDFIKIGDQQGESIPFAERNSYNQQDLKFGDGTQKLGMYICVLATEYALLYENERWTDLEKTKTELYYALEVIERLDCTTELYPPFNFSESVTNCNGYLNRDDVHAGFLDEPAKDWDLSDTRTNRDLINQDFTKFCYTHNLGDVTDLHNYPLDNTQGSSDLNGSDFITQQLDPSIRFNEPSKDQYLCLWQGLGLVVKYVHDYDYTIQKTDGSSLTYNFNDKAKELYIRLLENMKYTNSNMQVIPLPFQAGFDWTLTRPMPLGEITEFDGGVSAGIGIPFAFPMAQAANKVLFDENNFINHMAYLQIPLGYHDPTTMLSMNLIWRFTGPDYSNQTDGGSVNQSMYCQLAAMSDSWRLGPLSLINVTPQLIYAHAEDYDWEAYYTTLWSIWNKKPIPSMNTLRNRVINSIRDDMNYAPCEGPYNVTPIPTGIHDYSYQWASTFKYFRPLDEAFWGITALPNGYFNGLDYLLMHNMFYLMYNGNLPYYHDLIDRIIDYPVPAPGNPNNVTQPLAINAFHSITASSTVHSNFDVEFRAGYEMTFKPGFHVQAGANFHAYMEPFTCVNGEYREMENDSSLATVYGFNEKFNFKNHGVLEDSNEEIEEEVKIDEQVVDVSHLLFTYPNPCTDKFTYFLNEKVDENILQTVEVYNMIGDIVYSEQVNYNGQNIIDLGDVAVGLYIVKVISGEIVYSTKLILEK